jgi:hypothetical protein
VQRAAVVTVYRERVDQLERAKHGGADAKHPHHH